MTILGLLVLFLVVGLVVFLITQLIPMDPTVKRTMILCVCLVLIIIVLANVGVLGVLNTPIGNAHRP